MLADSRTVVMTGAIVIRIRIYGLGLGFRGHVPNDWVLRVLVIVFIEQVLGKYMNIRYLDPSGILIRDSHFS